MLKTKYRFEWQEKNVPNLYRPIMIPFQTGVLESQNRGVLLMVDQLTLYVNRIPKTETLQWIGYYNWHL